MTLIIPFYAKFRENLKTLAKIFNLTVHRLLLSMSVLRRGSVVVVDFLFIVTPIVGVCNYSMFCCTLLYVHSSIAIILMGK